MHHEWYLPMGIVHRSLPSMALGTITFHTDVLIATNLGYRIAKPPQKPPPIPKADKIGVDSTHNERAWHIQGHRHQGSCLQDQDNRDGM